MIFPEKGRAAAHFLIDAVSTADSGRGDADAVNLAYQRLLEADTFARKAGVPL